MQVQGFFVQGKEFTALKTRVSAQIKIAVGEKFSKDEKGQDVLR